MRQLFHNGLTTKSRRSRRERTEGRRHAGLLTCTMSNQWMASSFSCCVKAVLLSWRRTSTTRASFLIPLSPIVAVDSRTFLSTCKSHANIVSERCAAQGMKHRATHHEELSLARCSLELCDFLLQLRHACFVVYARDGVGSEGQRGDRNNCTARSQTGKVSVVTTTKTAQSGCCERCKDA
jgi:hypothetical protein